MNSKKNLVAKAAPISLSAVLFSRSIKKKALFLLFSGFAVCAYAQEAEESESMEDMLVIGEQSDERLSITEVSLETYTGFAKVIDRSEFEYELTSASEMLDFVPGIQVRESGGFGSFDSVSVRASTGKQVNFFIDGMLLNSATGGYANVSQISSVLVERIEAYPSFTPLQLGNANIGGAINFKTRALSEEERGARLKASVGSFGTQGQEITGWGEVANWNLIGGVSLLESDNDFPVDEDLFRTDSTSRINDGYEQDSYFLKASRGWSSVNTSLFIQYDEIFNELATQLNQLRDNSYLDSEDLRTQFVVDYRSGNWEFGHRVFFSSEDLLYSDPNGTIGLSNDDRIRTETDAIGLYNLATYKFDEHLLLVSFEAREDSINQADLIAEEEISEASRTTQILAISDEWDFSDNLLITAVVKNYWVEDSLEVFEENFDDFEEIDLSEAAANLGVKWSLNSNIDWKINLGDQIRIPTLNEKFGGRGLFEGNEELLREKAFTIDTGVDLNYDKIQANLTVFHRQLEDGIFTIYDSRGVGRAENIGESIVSGIEGQLNWKFTENLGVRSNLTVLDTENQSEIRSSNGNKLPGTYHQVYGVGIDYGNELHKFSIDFLRSEELYYESTNSVLADDKDEISASYTLFYKPFTWNVSVRNILDENFLDINRFPTPGRSFLTTLTLDL